VEENKTKMVLYKPTAGITVASLRNTVCV